jgi:hypothetical protein
VQVRAAQDRPLQVRLAQVGALEVRAGEVGAAQVDLVQVEPGRRRRPGIAGLGEGAAAEHGQRGLHIQRPGAQLRLAVLAVQRPVGLVLAGLGRRPGDRWRM